MHNLDFSINEIEFYKIRYTLITLIIWADYEFGNALICKIFTFTKNTCWENLCIPMYIGSNSIDILKTDIYV